MVAFWVIGLLTFIVLYYAVWGRECMKQKAWSKPVYEWIEPIEIALWRNSRTILWSRFKVLMAALLVGLGTIGAIDVTAFLAFVPEKHRWWVAALPPAALALDGLIQEIVRRFTTKPLALVAVQENKLPPDVKAAVDIAAGAERAAVAAVKEAKT